jgi:hypothetical protein
LLRQLQQRQVDEPLVLEVEEERRMGKERVTIHGKIKILF